MEKRPLYGAPTLTLSEVVDELMIAQGNDKRNHYFSYLIHAKWVWKELLRKTVWAIAQKVIDVPANRTITIPAGVERLVGISVVDHLGNLQPITFNPNINTLKATCTTKTCSCEACNGTDTLCEVLDQITFRTEDVNLDGVVYQKKIWNRKDASGNLTEVTDAPAYSVEDDAVKYVRTIVTLCEMEVDEQCCIKATERNRHLLYEHCGTYLAPCEFLNSYRYNYLKLDYKDPVGDYGFWKWEANSNDRIFLQHSGATKIILAYQANGDGQGEELLVPDFALDAVMFGIMYRQNAFSPVASRSEKEYSRADWLRNKTALEKYLNPISLSNFMRLGSSPVIW